MSLTSNHLNRDEQVQALADKFLEQHRNDFRVINGKWWSLHPVLRVWTTIHARDRAGKQLTQVVGSLDPDQHDWIYGAINKLHVQTRVLAWIAPDLHERGLPGPGWTPELAARYPDARF